jgi:transcriptional regulator with XRE-family HTH domain
MILPEVQIKRMLIEFGAQIKEWRTERNISADRFAFEIGISVNTLNRIEEGKIDFRFSLFLQITHVMKNKF